MGGDAQRPHAVTEEGYTQTDSGSTVRGVRWRFLSTQKNHRTYANCRHRPASCPAATQHGCLFMNLKRLAKVMEA